MVLVHGVPAAVGGLGLAAVFSAELSAADAALFMLTTSLSQDLYRRFVAPGATEAQMLRITRITAVVAGTLGVLVALVAASVITALSIFYTLMTVSLFVPILGGLYVSRAQSREALGAIARRRHRRRAAPVRLRRHAFLRAHAGDGRSRRRLPWSSPSSFYLGAVAVRLKPEAYRNVAFAAFRSFRLRAPVASAFRRKSPVFRLKPEATRET